MILVVRSGEHILDVVDANARIGKSVDTWDASGYEAHINMIS